MPMLRSKSSCYYAAHVQSSYYNKPHNARLSQDRVFTKGYYYYSLFSL